MKSHNQFITSVGLEISEEDQNLPYLYWTSKLHKSPYKHRFIAGSSKCTTKDLSCLLTKVLSTIKVGLVRYCNTKTSHNGVNNMWILKNYQLTSYQKFNNFLLEDTIFVQKVISHIQDVIQETYDLSDPRVKWEFLKYKIRFFVRIYKKEKAAFHWARRPYLEEKVKLLENAISSDSRAQVLHNY